jgi:hypothetical protein
MGKVIFFILLGFQSFSQNSKVAINYLMRNQNVYDSLDFDLFLKFSNPTKDSIYVYNVLNQGEQLYDPLSNILINLECLKNGEYKKVFIKNETLIFDLYNADSVFFSSLTKIGPNESRVVKINLLKCFYRILEGKYRISIRTLKIPNDIHKPTDMSYYPDKIIYFNVEKNFWGNTLR